MKKIIISICLIPLTAHAEIYQGHIGTSPIFLEIPATPLPEDNDAPNGAYFYQSSLVDIPLIVKSSTPKSYVLKTPEAFFSPVQSIETLTLDIQDQGQKMTGTWRNADGKNAAVQLDLLPGAKSMNDLKRKYLTFYKTKSAPLFGETVDWIKETHSKVFFPRLTQKNDSSINRLLLKKHQDNALSFLGDCSGEQNTKVALLSKNLLSLDITETSECIGAPHPNVGFYGQLLNRKTGLEYQLDDVIQFQKSAPKQVAYSESPEYKAYEHYMSQVFAPTLHKLVAARHYLSTDGKTDPEMMAVCSYSDEATWKDVSWVYTNEGIEFTPYFPYALMPCSVGFLVKWQALKPYLNPKFAYLKR